MDARIAVLPAHVIDQIAAGEVIERPASVVKELVDNALDAGATRITVETREGGRALIRVTDDGIGMAPADARLAIERHATSKITKVDDLWGLATMGFRGEALPSIGSVSRMMLTTRRAADLAATRVAIAGGRDVVVDEVGAAPGTTIEVADLFWNVPARLKFLRGEGTEASHVTDVVAKVAMAHPRLHVVLRHNGRVALDLPPHRDGLHRAHALLGARVGARLVAASGEEHGVRVTAFVGAPELAQTTARGVQLFVGRRPVRDRGLLHAIAMGYGELIPRGRYPIAIVHLDVPAGAVDYNVHPQKLEVRFTDAGGVGAAVRHVIAAAIARAPWRGEAGGFGAATLTSLAAITGVAAPELPFDGTATAAAVDYARALAEAPRGPTQAQASPSAQAQARFGFDAAPAVPQQGARAWASRMKEQVRASRAAEAAEPTFLAARGGGAHVDGGGLGVLATPTLVPVAAPAVGDDVPARFPLGSVGGGADAPTLGAILAAEGSGPAAPALASAPGFFATLRYLGQLDLTYLVCEGDGELVLVDQHAAHERVELAKLEASGDHDVAIQKLLFPVTLDASEAQLALVARVGGALARVGFEAEPFGRGTLAVKAVPAGIQHGDPAAVLRELLAAWVEDGVPSEEELIARSRATIACHSVVRAGDRLAPLVAEALLRSLDAARPASRYSGHGRPLVLRLPMTEIARRFGR